LREFIRDYRMIFQKYRRLLEMKQMREMKLIKMYILLCI